MGALAWLLSSERHQQLLLQTPKQQSKARSPSAATAPSLRTAGFVLTYIFLQCLEVPNTPQKTFTFEKMVSNRQKSVADKKYFWIISWHFFQEEIRSDVSKRLKKLSDGGTFSPSRNANLFVIRYPQSSLKVLFLIQNLYCQCIFWEEKITYSSEKKKKKRPPLFTQKISDIRTFSCLIHC